MFNTINVTISLYLALFTLFTYSRDLTELDNMNLHCGTIHIAELLLQMLHVPWSACACLSVGTRVSCAKKQLNRGLTLVGERKHMLGLYGIQSRSSTGKGTFEGTCADPL